MQCLKWHIENYVPYKKVTVGPRAPSFVTPLVKILLRKRNKLMKKGKNDEAESITSKIGSLISSQLKQTFSKVDAGNTKSLWSAVRLGKPKSCSFNLGNSDELNEFFVSVATDPEYDIDNITAKKRSNSRADSVQDSLTEYEVYRILSTIKKTSAGPDGLPFWVFKECATQLSPVTTFLLNKSICSGSPPTAWKRAIVTPIPKVSQPKELADMRPISVTPILSRITERIIVQRFLWPALSKEALLDQFAFRPTGSTTAALSCTMHFITKYLEEPNTKYVRCLLIDYSKAFDSVNHEIVLNKLNQLDLPDNIFNWILNFLTGRSQAVSLNQSISKWLDITQSCVQGSGLGPMLYVILAMDLKPLSTLNKIVKYADDKTLLCPSNTDISLEKELKHILEWSAANKLKLNLSKTKEIVFRRPTLHLDSLPPCLELIDRVQTSKLLGCIITDTLNTTNHVDYVLRIANQRLYLLNLLRKRGLNQQGLSIIFESIIIARVMYAMPAISGFISAHDLSRINKLFKKANKWGLTSKSYDFTKLASEQDKKLFESIKKNSDHCLNQLLTTKQSTYLNKLRRRGHRYSLPIIRTDLHKKSFVVRCLFTYR